MPSRQPRPSLTTSTYPIGIESELWSMADALRGSMDAAEYKHVVLGLIFLKYISNAFEERHAAVLGEWGKEAAEDPDEYTAESVFVLLLFDQILCNLRESDDLSAARDLLLPRLMSGELRVKAAEKFTGRAV